MKFVDYLKKLFDEDLDVQDSTSVKKEDQDKSTGDAESKLTNISNNKNTDEEAIEKAQKLDNINLNKNISEVEGDMNKQDEANLTFKTPVYNKETGMFDIDSVENEDLKKLLIEVNNNVKAKDDAIKIESAINEKLSSIKIRKGITNDAVKQLLKHDKISVDDKGAVVGIDEAFEDLKTNQSGLFVQRNTYESSPLLEGYNPSVENSDNSGLESSLAFLSESLK